MVKNLQSSTRSLSSEACTTGVLQIQAIHHLVLVCSIRQLQLAAVFSGLQALSLDALVSRDD